MQGSNKTTRMGFMRKRERFFFVFFLLFFASLVILALSVAGKLKIVSFILENTISPVGAKTYSIFHKLPFISKSTESKKLKEEKLDKAVLLSEIEKLKNENAALKDQFQTQNPRSYNLLPAKIVGHALDLVVDKGETDGVQEGQVAVFKNNLVGRVKKVSSYLSSIELIFNSSSFTGKTMTSGVAGIVKSDGRQTTFDNVSLSDNIEVGEIVVTKGDLNLEGIGYPPDLIVGRITSIDRKPSSLFQKGRVESFVDFNDLDMVFILKI